MEEEKVLTSKDYIRGLPSYIKYVLLYILFQWKFGFKLFVKLDYYLCTGKRMYDLELTDEVDSIIYYSVNCGRRIKTAFYKRSFKHYEILKSYD